MTSSPSPLSTAKRGQKNDPRLYLVTLRLADTATRLAHMDDDLQERLINWGYAICDAGVRRWVDPEASPPSDFPYPAAGVG